MVGFAGALSDKHVAKFEQKPNVVHKPEELTLAFGTWGLPGLVEHLKNPKSVEYEKKVLVALEELCRVAEHAVQAVKAGVVQAVLDKVSGADGSTRIPPIDLCLALLRTLSKDTSGRRALLSSSALPQLKHLAPKGVGLDELVRNVCTLREGADACFEAGYLELLRPCLLSTDASPQYTASEASRWLKVLAKMLTESATALHFAAEHTTGAEMASFLQGWPQRGQEDEDWLCAGVEVLLAITVEDAAKKVAVEAGAVDAAALVLAAGEAPDTAELSPRIGWLAQSQLLALITQLCVVVSGKNALVKGGWLRMLSRGLKGADSVLLQRAVAQCLLHTADHPSARGFLLNAGTIQDLQDLEDATTDEFVKRICQRCVESLNWTP